MMDVMTGQLIEAVSSVLGFLVLKHQKGNGSSHPLMGGRLD